MPGGLVDFPDARVVGHKDIDLALDRNAFGFQDGVDAGADIGGDHQTLHAALLEYQIDLISHWFSSFDTVPGRCGTGYFQALRPFRKR